MSELKDIATAQLLIDYSKLYTEIRLKVASDVLKLITELLALEYELAIREEQPSG